MDKDMNNETLPSPAEHLPGLFESLLVAREISVTAD